MTASHDDVPENSGQANVPRVFISYCSDDADTAATLSRLCEQAGFDTWLDKRDLRPGDDWRAKIDEAVQKCNIFLLLISSATLRGEATSPVEWSSICERRWSGPDVILIPIRLDSVPLPPFLRKSHYLNAPDPAALSKCVNEIQNFSPDFSDTRGFSDFSDTRGLWHLPEATHDDTTGRFKDLFAAVSRRSFRSKTETDPESTK
jgi:hypothetical protein